MKRTMLQLTHGKRTSKHYTNARFVFLTATPFRRDKKAIPGRMAYWYPVLRASKENAFGRVSFRAAPLNNDQDQGEIDRSVASSAFAQLQADKAAGYDHRLFARASSIKSAHELVPIYTALGARVAPIDSSVSKKRQDEVEGADAQSPAGRPSFASTCLARDMISPSSRSRRSMLLTGHLFQLSSS